jgi:lipoprotein-anchoring transpeptidase ErfK/SrfK
MHLKISVIGLLAFAAGCTPMQNASHATAPASPMPIQLSAAAPLQPDIATPPSDAAATVPPIDVEAAAARLGIALRREVPHAIADGPAAAQQWIERAQAAIAASDNEIDRPQTIVVVDRNPRVQQLRLIVARPDGAWQDLGGSKVSTGETGRFDYYVTPTGVFAHTELILDWRAEGTFNEHHIRGLGMKGMRVWDFGWQQAARGWGTGDEGEIRLLMHATDPAYLEQRLGRRASKGCVRLPDAMNRFLDRHGILDRDYEQAAGTDPAFAALLLPDRDPTPLAGDLLVVIDSSAAPVPAA